MRRDKVFTLEIYLLKCQAGTPDTTSVENGN